MSFLSGLFWIVIPSSKELNNSLHWKEYLLKFPDAKIMVDNEYLYIGKYPEEYTGYVNSGYCDINYYDYPTIIKISKDGREETGILYNEKDSLISSIWDQRLFIHNNTIYFEKISKSKKKGKREMKDYIIMFLIALIVVNCRITWKLVFKPLKKAIKHLVDSWDEA